MEENQPMRTLETVEHEIRQTMNALLPRQRTFVELVAGGTMSKAKAIVLAGYSAKTAARQTGRMMKNAGVARALELLRERDELVNGIPTNWKRSVLKHVATVASDPDHEKYHGITAVKAVNELNQMDGHHAVIKHRHQHAHVSVSLVYNLDIGREPPVDSGGQNAVNTDIIDVEP